MATAPALAQVADVPSVAPETTVPATVGQEDAMPVAPRGVAATFVTPPRDAAGGYVTPNRDLTAEETVWHLRVALNVAALGCRDADEAATVLAYNALLAGAKAELVAAQEGVARHYRTRFGAAAQARNDDNMTKLYNFFAQPTGHDGFCTTAKAVLSEAQTAQGFVLANIAATALPRLEAPFLAFFASYDLYRAQLAAWNTRHPVTMASAAASAAASAPPAPAAGLVNAATPPLPAASGPAAREPSAQARTAVLTTAGAAGATASAAVLTR